MEDKSSTNDNLTKASSASEDQTDEKLLVESRSDSTGKKIKIWPTPLSEDAVYSLFSENKLLLDQE